jgi:CheY-like chemotaxis protein
VGAGAEVTVPKRILVMDDEPGVRRLLSDVFASEGYLVSEASDGAQGLNRLHAFRPISSSST